MSRRTRRRRAEASYGPQTGTTYLLHFIDPATGEPARYKHAGHYIGWTTDLAARLDAHARGRGARLVEVITKAGIDFKVARIWPGTTRDREDLLKHAGGGRRYCPDCWVTPRQDPGPLPEVQRLSLYELEHAGTWLDGTPLTEPDPYADLPGGPGETTHRKEAEMFGRDRRAAARQEAAQQAEADRLFAEADRLDIQADDRPGYQHEISAERAARIRDMLAEDLVRDARAQAPERGLTPDELAARAVDLARDRPAELSQRAAAIDAEIDRLAELYPEPPDPPFPPGPDSTPEEVDAFDQWAWEQGERERGETIAQLQADADRRADEDLGREIIDDEQAAQPEPEAGPGRDPGPAPDHLYGAPECTEPDPGTDHFGRCAAEPEDAGRFPLPRVLDASEASPVLAPVAATLPGGTPHTDPFLAGRGWQAQDGLYVRQPQAQLEAG